MVARNEQRETSLGILTGKVNMNLQRNPFLRTACDEIALQCDLAVKERWSAEELSNNIRHIMQEVRAVSGITALLDPVEVDHSQE